MQIKSPLQEQVPVNVMKPAVEAFQNSKKTTGIWEKIPCLLFFYTQTLIHPIASDTAKIRTSTRHTGAIHFSIMV